MNSWYPASNRHPALPDNLSVLLCSVHFFILIEYCFIFFNHSSLGKSHSIFYWANWEPPLWSFHILPYSTSLNLHVETSFSPFCLRWLSYLSSVQRTLQMCFASQVPSPSHRIYFLHCPFSLLHHQSLSSHQTVSCQFSSVTQSCPTFCYPKDCSTPLFPFRHQLPEFTQTDVHRIGDAIQPSHPLPAPSPPAFNLSQHQGLLQWVGSPHQVAKVIMAFQLQHQSFQWIFRTDFL